MLQINNCQKRIINVCNSKNKHRSTEWTLALVVLLDAPAVMAVHVAAPQVDQVRVAM